MTEKKTRNSTSKSPRRKTLSNKLHHMVAEAAYYRAEKRGFEPGNEMEDWIEAENEITHKTSS